MSKCHWDHDLCIFPVSVYVVTLADTMGIFMLRLMLGHWNSSVLKAAWNGFFRQILTFLEKKKIFFHMIIYPAELEGPLNWILNELIGPAIRRCLNKTCICHTLHRMAHYIYTEGEIFRNISGKRRLSI